VNNRKTSVIFFAVLTAVSGTLLHFLYDWSGKNVFVGLFAPVSESVWEHMKLLFYPVLFFSLIEFFRGNSRSGFIPARTCGLFSGLFLMPVLFYTYSGIIGRNFLFADILIFLICVAFTYFITEIVPMKSKGKRSVIAPLLLILVSMILFTAFTLCPPGFGIFVSPTE